MGRCDSTLATEERRYRSLKRDTRWVTVLIVVLLIVLMLLLLMVWWLLRPSAIAGSRIVPQAGMTASEAQELVDEGIEKSRITVSLQPAPQLDSESGMLGINFIVVPDNNGFSERFEIEQEGATVYRSEVVHPGHQLAKVEARQVKQGKATATVYAVDEEGRDHGNPVSVEIEVQ